MNRNQSPWGTREVFGRIQLATPVTQPCVELTTLVTAAARRKRWAWRILVVLLVGLVAALAFGCAHRGPQPLPESVTIAEPYAGVVAGTFAKATGFRVRATTIPKLPTIVFGPQSACVVEDHEGAHRAQQRRDGAAVFTARYLEQWWTCIEERGEGLGAFGWCARYGVDYEREAYEVQAACEAKGVQSR